jgi:hypothetical protein
VPALKGPKAYETTDSRGAHLRARCGRAFSRRRADPTTKAGLSIRRHLRERGCLSAEGRQGRRGADQADFEIFEDGKPQAVEEFEFVRVAPNTPDEERRDPTSIEDSNREAADPHNRVFVVYLDTYSVTLFGIALRTSADHRVSLANNRAQGSVRRDDARHSASAITFARRTETLEAELRKYWDWGEGERTTTLVRDSAEGRLATCGLARLTAKV